MSSLATCERSVQQQAGEVPLLKTTTLAYDEGQKAQFNALSISVAFCGPRVFSPI